MPTILMPYLFIRKAMMVNFLQRERFRPTNTATFADVLDFKKIKTFNVFFIMQLNKFKLIF